MANQHRQKLRGIRGIDDQLWSDFEQAAARLGTDRSDILRRYIEWVVGRPGAQLPDRPEAPGPSA
jgi:hypothetical protein